jgi:hypothetical protein
VDPSRFPWRQLGTLLVERGLLTEARLERALAEQQRTGRLLGVILVESGYLTGPALARVLAEQHGVELRPAGEDLDAVPADLVERTSAALQPESEWRPLGTLLVEHGFLERAELDGALAAQRQRPGLRLGELLVQCNYLSGPELARALALQQGVDVAEGELGADLDTVLHPSQAGEKAYTVCEVVFDPDYRTGSALYRSVNFLEAAEFALEYVDEHDPRALEIQCSADGRTFEPVWTYSEPRAASLAATRKPAVEKYGFDPFLWGQ